MDQYSKKHFTPFEKELLVKLIQQFNTVVNSRCTTAASNRMKLKTWDAIAEIYNNSPGVEGLRSASQLSCCHKNMKQRIRDQMREKTQSQKTQDEVVQVDQNGRNDNILLGQIIKTEREDELNLILSSDPVEDVPLSILAKEEPLSVEDANSDDDENILGAEDDLFSATEKHPESIQSEDADGDTNVEPPDSNTEQPAGNSESIAKKRKVYVSDAARRILQNATLRRYELNEMHTFEMECLRKEHVAKMKVLEADYQERKLRMEVLAMKLKIQEKTLELISNPGSLPSLS